MLRKDEPEKFNDSKIESPTDQHPYPNQHDSLDKTNKNRANNIGEGKVCLLYTSPSPRDLSTSRMPSSA